MSGTELSQNITTLIVSYIFLWEPWDASFLMYPYHAISSYWSCGQLNFYRLPTQGTLSHSPILVSAQLDNLNSRVSHHICHFYSLLISKNIMGMGWVLCEIFNWIYYQFKLYTSWSKYSQVKPNILFWVLCDMVSNRLE